MKRTFDQAALIAINWHIAQAKKHWNNNAPILQYLGITKSSIEQLKATLLNEMKQAPAMHTMSQAPSIGMIDAACRSSHINPAFMPTNCFTYISAGGEVIARSSSHNNSVIL